MQKKIQWEVIYIPINWWNLLGFFFIPNPSSFCEKNSLARQKKIAYQQEEKTMSKTVIGNKSDCRADTKNDTCSRGNQDREEQE